MAVRATEGNEPAFIKVEAPVTASGFPDMGDAHRRQRAPPELICWFISIQFAHHAPGRGTVTDCHSGSLNAFLAVLANQLQDTTDALAHLLLDLIFPFLRLEQVVRDVHGGKNR